MQRSSLMLGLALTAAGLGGVAQADLVNFDGQSVYVEYWAGSGENQMVFCVEFDDGVKGAFGHQWSGAVTPSSFQALQAIDQGGALEFEYTTHPLYGAFLNKVVYKGHELLGFNAVTSEYAGLWLSEDGVAWTESPVGMSTDMVSPGAWRGYAKQPAFGLGGPSNTPDISTSPVQPVPEPASLSLLALSAVALLRRRK